MKSSILMTALLPLGTLLTSSAQDVIIFRTGEELKAKVAEVGITEIRYKKFDNLNGPLYTTLKAEVLLIKYENGTKDVFSISSFSAPNLALPPKAKHESDLQASRKKLVSGIVMTAIGAPAVIPGIILTAVGLSLLNNPNPNNNDNWQIDGAPVFFTGATLLGVGLPLTIIGPIKIASAKKMRAKARASNATLGFNPVLGGENLGLSGNFRAGAGVTINF